MRKTRFHITWHEEDGHPIYRGFYIESILRGCVGLILIHESRIELLNEE